MYLGRKFSSWLSNIVCDDFKEQLTRSNDGWYETGLLWKVGNPTLSANKKGSLSRLCTLLKKLKRQPELYPDYDAVIQEYLEQGIVERVPDHATPTGKVFYIPHNAFVREKLKVRNCEWSSLLQHDKMTEKAHRWTTASKQDRHFQNLLWNILVRNSCTVALAGDVGKTFLLVRIRQEDRDALRFHCIKDTQTEEIETLRFSRTSLVLPVCFVAQWNNIWRPTVINTKKRFKKSEEVYT